MYLDRMPAVCSCIFSVSHYDGDWWAYLGWKVTAISSIFIASDADLNNGSEYSL